MALSFPSKTALLLFVLASFAFLSGQERISPSPPVASQPAAPLEQSGSALAAPMASPNSDLLLGPGDLLEVSVYGAPDFDKKEMRVTTDGNVLVPMVGSIHIAGLTVSRAQEVIAKKLSDGEFFNDPQVTIFVKDYATQGVSILGEVQKPGVYPVVGPRQLYDAISLAGGLTPKAGRFVTIKHRDNTVPTTIEVSNDPQKRLDANVSIQPGDTVIVSKAGIVYVVGDVKLPGGFVMENGKMTVLQAIALAQGANSTASLDNAKLIRQENGEQKTEPIPLKKILRAKAQDQNLEPGDIVFVPNSAAKSGFRRTLEAAVQTASGLAIYGGRY